MNRKHPGTHARASGGDFHLPAGPDAAAPFEAAIVPDSATTVTADVNIAAGQTVTLSGANAGYETSGSSPISLTNAGTVNISGDGAIGFWTPFLSTSGAHFTNKATGIFHVSGSDEVFGIRGGPLTPVITNNGDFQVTSDLSAFGAYGFYKYINAGSWTITGTHSAVGVDNFGGSVTNTGTIAVTGGDMYAYGVVTQQGNHTFGFDNSGTITVTSTDHSDPSVALIVEGDAGTTGVYTNSGTITGDYAIREFPLAFASFATLAAETIDNSGTLNGIVDLGLGNDTIDNTHIINGDIYLDQGNDTYSGATGTLNGSLFAGFGDDTVAAGSNADHLFGQEGNDTIDGGAGNDIVDGGHDDDALSGGDGDDQLFGGFGNDALHGGAGNDVLEGGQGADLLDGGTGADTLVIASASQSTGTGFDTAVGFDFSQDKFQLASVPTVINAAVTGGSLSNATFASDLASLASASALSAHGAVLVEPGSGDYAGQTFLVIDANGQAGYQNGQDIVVCLQNATGALALGDFVQGGSAYAPLPFQGDAIYNDYTNFQSETLSLSYSGTDLVLTGFLLTELQGYAMPSLTNGGSITVTTASQLGAIGIRPDPETATFLPGGNFWNLSTGVVTVTANDYVNEVPGHNGRAEGVEALQIQNDGQITVTSSGNASGISAGHIVNTGTISVTGYNFASGVDGGGFSDFFDNSGTVMADSAQGQADCVSLGDANSTLDNEGTIIAKDETAAFQSVAILSVHEDFRVETVVNSGLVQGDYAFRDNGQAVFSPTPASADIIDNSGKMIGLIDTAGGNDQIQNTGEIDGNVTLGDGDDVFAGSLGTLKGTLDGGDGNDTLSAGAGANSVTGDAGNDVLDGGTGNDTRDGGSGSDTASYGDAAAAVKVSLAVTVAQNVGGGQGSDTLTSIENLTGSAFNDTLSDNSGSTVLSGGGGDDTLNLYKGGNDTAQGGDGNDTIVFRDKLINLDTVDGGAGSDTLVLQGDYSGGLAFLSNGLVSVETISLVAHHAYAFTMDDGNVAAGASLTIQAKPLLPTDSLAFDGSHELDGSFNVVGGRGNDTITGGAGNDVLSGRGGADHLTGGAGADHFVYTQVSDSTGATFDTVTGFDAAADAFDLPFLVKHFNTPVAGALSAASFDTDLANALGAGQLSGHHALLFTASSGAYAGDTFLVVDMNNVAGYQAGHDLVIMLDHPANMGGFGAGNFI